MTHIQHSATSRPAYAPWCCLMTHTQHSATSRPVYAPWSCPMTHIQHSSTSRPTYAPWCCPMTHTQHSATSRPTYAPWSCSMTHIQHSATSRPPWSCHSCLFNGSLSLESQTNCPGAISQMGQASWTLPAALICFDILVPRGDPLELFQSVWFQIVVQTQPMSSCYIYCCVWINMVSVTWCTLTWPDVWSAPHILMVWLSCSYIGVHEFSVVHNSRESRQSNGMYNSTLKLCVSTALKVKVLGRNAPIPS